MASINEHMYSIRGIISRGVSSDDSRITNSLIEHSLNMARATLLKQRMDKFDDISESNYQPICITLQDSNPTECSLPFTLPNECMVKKSTAKIPLRITARWGSPSRVRFLDGRRIGNLTQAQAFDAQYSLSRPDLKASYFFQEQYLYILGDKNLKKVRLWDLFEDPKDADDISSCPVDTEAWPIDSDLVIPLYQLTLQLMGIAYNFPEDAMNDARDVAPPQPQKAK